MKKKFQILAATIITVAFISCSKEKVELTETPITTNEEIATSNTSNRPLVDPLTIKLDGWFTFNATLKDQTKSLLMPYHPKGSQVLHMIEKALPMLR